MRFHHHAQRPYDAEIRRRLFQDRREARVRAAWEFLAALALTLAAVGALTFIISTLTGTPS
jgi:hypothetical protein